MQTIFRSCFCVCHGCLLANLNLKIGHPNNDINSNLTSFVYNELADIYGILNSLNSSLSIIAINIIDEINL